MSTIDKGNRVHELTDVPLPSPSAPNPLVLADEDTLVVSYITAKDGAAAIVVFRQCYASHFGPPIDEAFVSHPLAGLGLSPYGAFEVESSTWLRGLEVRNRSHPRHDPQLFHQLRHWVWTFHDSVLECAALGYTAVEAPGRPDDLLPRMHALLG
jgi:hypothetical protein